MCAPIRRDDTMRRTLFFVPLLVGCMASSPQRPGNPDYGTKPSAREAHAAIAQDLRKHLKDPDSVKDFALAQPSPDCLFDERGWECGWKVCASYNAKNSYGAY